MKTITLFVMLFAVTPSFGVTIGQWTFEGDVQTPVSVAPNTTASAFTLNSGSVGFVTGNPGRAISGTAWTGADGTKWWEFTVTALAGFTLDLASLTFDDQRSGTGPSSWSVTVNGITATSAQATHGSFSVNIVDLSAIAFQNLSSVNVRISGFGASSSSGTWRLDDVTLAGNITETRSVPETLPLAFAAFAFMTVILLSRFVARPRLGVARILPRAKKNRLLHLTSRLPSH